MHACSAPGPGGLLPADVTGVLSGRTRFCLPGNTGSLTLCHQHYTPLHGPLRQLAQRPREHPPRHAQDAVAGPAGRRGVTARCVRVPDQRQEHACRLVQLIAAPHPPRGPERSSTPATGTSSAGSAQAGPQSAYRTATSRT